MSQSPKLASVLDRAAGAKLKGLRVALPARVETYDEATRLVSVQPLIMDGFVDESGNRKADRLPVINDVPIVFPGSGGARVRFPVLKGDTVLLVFSSSSLDKWLVSGGEVDPKTDHRHALTDAIAIPGLQATPDAGDADVLIEFTDNGQIHAGGSDELVKRSEFLQHGHGYLPGPGLAVATTGPITNIAPDGSAVLFPGTSILKGA